ncbi:ADP ribosylation factor 6-like protein [Daphnia magna]|uniref:ADP ribosylation factor 6-like protein n=1 Tax=Daphnia magna TaxID=35525 RepID=A0A164UJZ2_9CRUS|nr:ADP ribosylation factor 6-like protein [Daphnia magna]
MGTTVSNLFSRFSRKKQMRIVMIGHPSSGKTTILYHLKSGKVVTTIPTTGFNLETLEHKNIRIDVWDIGGGDKIRALWPHYLRDAQGIIFVVDSKDTEILHEVWGDLKLMLQDEGLRNVPILLYANKQDLAESMSVRELADKLDVNLHLAGRRWHIQSASALQGNGLRAGFLWLVNELSKSAIV